MTVVIRECEACSKCGLTVNGLCECESEVKPPMDKTDKLEACPNDAVIRAEQWMLDYDKGKLTASDLYTRCLLGDLLTIIRSRALVAAPPPDVEKQFLDASVAVWREIDRLSALPEGYKGLPPETDPRKRELAAWEAYREALDAPSPVAATVDAEMKARYEVAHPARYTMTHPVHPDIVVLYFLALKAHWFDDPANMFYGQREQAKIYLYKWVETGELADDSTTLEITTAMKFREWLESSWTAAPSDSSIQAAARHYSCSCGGALTAEEYIEHYFEKGHDRGDLPTLIRAAAAEIAEQWSKHDLPPIAGIHSNPTLQLRALIEHVLSKYLGFTAVGEQWFDLALRYLRGDPELTDVPYSSDSVFAEFLRFWDAQTPHFRSTIKSVFQAAPKFTTRSVRCVHGVPEGLTCNICGPIRSDIPAATPTDAQIARLDAETSQRVDTRANVEWLSTNAERYFGQWIAIRNGELLDADKSWRALGERIGSTKGTGILITWAGGRIRNSNTAAVGNLPICPACQQGYVCEHCGKPIGDYYANVAATPKSTEEGKEQG